MKDDREYQEELEMFRKLHQDTVNQLEQDFQRMFQGVLTENVLVTNEMLQEK